MYNNREEPAPIAAGAGLNFLLSWLKMKFLLFTAKNFMEPFK
jgi:hypothetical protein